MMSTTLAMDEEQYSHSPVLLKEAREILVTDPNGIYLDATVGLGGHAEAILKSISAQGQLVGIDMDPEALFNAEKRLAPFTGKFRLVHGNFRNLSQILRTKSSGLLTGALFDLGVCSLHLDKASRGFAIAHEGPLDMRLDPANPLTAERIVNEWPVEQLELLLREYGEEREAGKIARWIVQQRNLKPFKTTQDLKRLIESKRPNLGSIHPATKTFMALRIAVNQELENLTRGLESVAEVLKPKGRIVVISFHSLEDRIVKRLFQSYVSGGGYQWVHPSVVRPSPEEVERNPRSRSARLRAVEKQQ